MSVPSRILVEPDGGALDRILAFCRDSLAGIGDDRLLQAIELVAEELVTNIREHGEEIDREPIEVTITVETPRVVFEVRDASSRPIPFFEPPQSDIDTPGGRGLLLIRGLPDEVSYERDEEGRNVVTCVFSLTGSSAEAPAEGTSTESAAAGGEAPRLREGVELRPLQNRAYHLTGPGLDSFIVDEGTATVLERCDGRSIEAVTDDLNERYGWSLSSSDVGDVVSRWARYGYFADEVPRSRRLLRFDPRVLLKLLGPLQVFYGRRLTTVVALLLATAGCYLTATRGMLLLGGLSGIARSRGLFGPVVVILGYYAGYMVTALFHEVGHALAVRRLGGEVPEMGILRSLSFYVLSNKEVLLRPADRVWYYAGGLLSDSVWWVGAWVWMLAAPGPVPLLLVVPQTVYFLAFAWAPSGTSDMSRVYRELFGWEPLPRLTLRRAGLSGWSTAPKLQVALESLRLGMIVAITAVVLFYDLLLMALYVVYRLLRRGLAKL